MKSPKNASRIILFGAFLVFFISTSYAKTKEIKRLKSNVDISSVYNFVPDSFDIYNKAYMYRAYATAGKSIDYEYIDVLEDALDDLDTTPDSKNFSLSISAIYQNTCSTYYLFEEGVTFEITNYIKNGKLMGYSELTSFKNKGF